MIRLLSFIEIALEVKTGTLINILEQNPVQNALLYNSHFIAANVLYNYAESGHVEGKYEEQI